MQKSATGITSQLQKVQNAQDAAFKRFDRIGLRG